MLCATGDGEPLWIAQRPGNAAANNISDHLKVLDGAIAQLPAAVASGHQAGDDAASARREIWLRVDAAGCSKNLAQDLRDRNVVYFMAARSNDAITAAIAGARTDRDMWQRAAKNPKQRNSRAQVAELTDSIDLTGWPEHTRLIVRREPLHPGAQRTLFDSPNWRYWGFLTDAAGDAAELDETMRGHARVEDTIKRLKDSGLARMPFTDWTPTPPGRRWRSSASLWSPGSSSSASTATSPKQHPKSSAGSSGTPQDASRAPRGAPPCGSPTAGPPPEPCSPPTPTTDTPAATRSDRRAVTPHAPTRPTPPSRTPTSPPNPKHSSPPAPKHTPPARPNHQNTRPGILMNNQG